ncbi:unnamed protein product [Protopolystoma xenopodis]|uniref:Uncharacterized protein n=1 Tax=Protopolystoma xenopodis TaxID=117903 RepID=A0A448WJV5_9PLAT|nr:unnamed protein product [Protopolystoma xenopodis]
MYAPQTSLQVTSASSRRELDYCTRFKNYVQSRAVGRQLRVHLRWPSSKASFVWKEKQTLHPVSGGSRLMPDLGPGGSPLRPVGRICDPTLLPIRPSLARSYGGRPNDASGYQFDCEKRDFPAKASEKLHNVRDANPEQTVRLCSRPSAGSIAAASFLLLPLTSTSTGSSACLGNGRLLCNTWYGRVGDQ